MSRDRKPSGIVTEECKYSQFSYCAETTNETALARMKRKVEPVKASTKVDVQTSKQKITAKPAVAQCSTTQHHNWGLPPPRPAAKPELNRKPMGPVPITKAHPVTGTVVPTGLINERHPLKEQLMKLLKTNFPENHRRVLPVGWGTGRPNGYVFTKRMGIDNGPHPGCCVNIYGFRIGCRNGD
jgi:hypothetical protein